MHARRDGRPFIPVREWAGDLARPSRRPVLHWARRYGSTLVAALALAGVALRRLLSRSSGVAIRLMAVL